MTIDMKSYAGDAPVEAAAPQMSESEVIQGNTYQQDNNDYPVHQEFLTPEMPLESSERPLESNKASETQEHSNRLTRDDFRALTQEVEKLKSEREAERHEFKQNLELLRANVAQQRQPEPPRNQSIFEEIGLKKTDIPNVAEIEAVWQKREANYMARIEELEVASSHPDYVEVLRDYTAPLLKQKPHLAQGIASSDNKALFAYELGKMHKELATYKNQQTPNANPPIQNSTVAERIVANANKPRNLSTAGGQGALSHADKYANMSDKEFMEIASKHLGDI